MFFLPFVDSFFAFLAENPLIRGVQGIMLTLASLLVFLVFWTTRDIAQRTNLLVAQLSCIFLVATLPIVGFFVYLLIRPVRTLKEKEVERSFADVLAILKERELRKGEVQAIKEKAKQLAVEKPSPARVTVSEPATEDSSTFA